MSIHQQLRTPARWRSAPVPEGFGSEPYAGLTGRVVLPLALDWSPGGVERNLDNPEDLLEIYEIVLTVGTADDVETYVDPRRLVVVWDEMMKPGAVIETWGDWVAERQLLWR